MARVTPIDAPSLGDRSYLVVDGPVGFAIGPQRGIYRPSPALIGPATAGPSSYSSADFTRAVESGLAVTASTAGGEVAA
ncbi:MAG: hypothetical protein ACYCS7_03595 [Acidimicrobiales bacterium]